MQAGGVIGGIDGPLNLQKLAAMLKGPGDEFLQSILFKNRFAAVFNGFDLRIRRPVQKEIEIRNR